MVHLPRLSSLHVVEQEDVEYLYLVDTLGEEFENEIDTLLKTTANPFTTREFPQSLASKFQQKLAKFDEERQYPVGQREKNRKNLEKSMHLRFLRKAALKEAIPLIEKGFKDPSSYFWVKIREDFDTVKSTVSNFFNSFVAPLLDSDLELKNEIKTSYQDQVDEIFKELVTKLADDLFLTTNFDSKFSKVTVFDCITFGLFANIKDKYIKACEYVMDLVEMISNYQMDPLNPVVLFDGDKIDALRRNLMAHADARKEKALSKRSVKRIRALKIGVGVGGVIGIGSLILAGAILICYLPPAGATVLVGALGCLALKIAALVMLMYTKNQEAIENTVRDIISGSGWSKKKWSF